MILILVQTFYMMEHQMTLQLRVSGYFTLLGAITMIIGAALWGSTGTDLWAALANETIGDYLIAVAPFKTRLAANTSFWSLGVILLGIGICGLASRSKHPSGWASIAGFCARTGVSLGIVSFVMMFALAIQIAPDTSLESIRLASVIGWIGTRLDDIATILIIGVGPVFLSVAGRDQWVPGWLRIWGYIAGFVALLAVAGLFIAQLYTMSILLVPFGMGWMIAAGIVAMRSK